MTTLGFIIIGICVVVGIAAGNFFFKRFPNLLNKLFNKFNKDKKMEEVLKNPHLLVEKLKSSGKIYDMGKELDIKVGQDANTGQDVVVVEEIESKKAKKIQKKIAAEDKTKKKIKLGKSHKKKGKKKK